MMTNTQIQNIIHKTIISTWKEKIPEDYDHGWLLKEDTLKNALYFHLRNALEELFKENDIRIFTEFTDAEFKGSRCRPDLVIAKVDMDKPVNCWGNAVTDCLAVIEIKYKAGFRPHEEIEADYEKLKYYAEDLNVTGRLYMATIWECEDDATAWIRKNAAWAKGKVTELNASYKRNSNYEPQFYVVKH